MTRYQTILNLNDTFVKLIGTGLIPVHLLDWKVYYEAYLQELEKQKRALYKIKKTDAVESVAENFDVSRRQMFYIISFMEGN